MNNSVISAINCVCHGAHASEKNLTGLLIFIISRPGVLEEIMRTYYHDFASMYLALKGDISEEISIETAQFIPEIFADAIRYTFLKEYLIDCKVSDEETPASDVTKWFRFRHPVLYEECLALDSQMKAKCNSASFKDEKESFLRTLTERPNISK